MLRADQAASQGCERRIILTTRPRFKKFRTCLIFSFIFDHHSITPSLHHSITPSLHHSITPSLHHSITPSLHHSITPSLHHSITPSLRYSVAPTLLSAPLSRTRTTTKDEDDLQRLQPLHLRRIVKDDTNRVA